MSNKEDAWPTIVDAYPHMFWYTRTSKRYVVSKNFYTRSSTSDDPRSFFIENRQEAIDKWLEIAPGTEGQVLAAIIKLGI